MTINRLSFLSCLLTLMLPALVAVQALADEQEQAPLSLIPLPEHVERHAGEFTVAADTRIVVVGAHSGLIPVAVRFASPLRLSMGVPLPIEVDSAPSPHTIRISCNGDAAVLKAEGYQLEVDAQGVVITAATVAGASYALTTLQQLLPVECYARTRAERRPWTIPAVSILDRPRFARRGILLDVGRHFFSRESVFRLLDQMALHKLNVLQLHLTEDQGWRIQIKRYPLLTELGSMRASTPIPSDSSREDGLPYGPFFYTQGDIRAIVAHASSLAIEIVPEIEMPGHSKAALACYPNLSCTGGPFAVGTHWGVEQDVYCAGNEETFTFLQNVLDEVIQLFPGPYIHIGGDECPKERWKTCAKCQAIITREGLKNEDDLQSWFIRRIATYLASKGKKIIGWDEILEGSTIPNATVTVWRDAAAGAEAARRGSDVIMCPGSHCYLDHAQAHGSKEPPNIGGLLTLETAYSFDPMPPGIDPKLASHLIGMQGNLWSEYIETWAQAEYMLWPRAAALAEVAWSPSAGRDFHEFHARLQVHLQRLDLLGVTSRPLDPSSGPKHANVLWKWTPADVSETLKTVTFPLPEPTAQGKELHLTFQYDHGAHRLEIASVTLLAADHSVISTDKHTGMTGGFDRDNEYVLAIAGATGALTVQAEIRSDGGTDSYGDVEVTP